MAKILIVEDDVIAASALHRLVRMNVPASWEIEVHAGETGAEHGLAAILVDRSISIVIADFRMPNMTGDALVRHALQGRPDLRGRIIISTALFLPDLWEEELFGKLGCLRLDKPVDIDAAVAMIWKLIHEVEPGSS